MSQFNPKTAAGREIAVFIDRLQTKDAEIAALQNDKRDIYEEIRSRGHNVRGIKAILRRLRKDPQELAQEEAVLHDYLRQLGMDVPQSLSAERASDMITGTDSFPSELSVDDLIDVNF